MENVKLSNWTLKRAANKCILLGDSPAPFLIRVPGEVGFDLQSGWMIMGLQGYMQTAGPELRGWKQEARKGDGSDNRGGHGRCHQGGRGCEGWHPHCFNTGNVCPQLACWRVGYSTLPVQGAVCLSSDRGVFPGPFWDQRHRSPRGLATASRHGKRWVMAQQSWLVPMGIACMPAPLLGTTLTEWQMGPHKHMTLSGKGAIQK